MKVEQSPIDAITDELLVVRALVPHPSDNELFLVAQRSLDTPKDPGLFEAPGGKVKRSPLTRKFAETMDEALTREVFHESGLVVVRNSSWFYSEGYPIADGDKYVGRDYRVYFALARVIGVDLTAICSPIQRNPMEWLPQQAVMESEQVTAQTRNSLAFGSIAAHS